MSGSAKIINAKAFVKLKVITNKLKAALSLTSEATNLSMKPHALHEKYLVKLNILLFMLRPK